jgi:PAS domain S-box-containing protein
MTTLANHRVLLVEESDEYAELVRRRLAGFTLTRARTADDVETALVLGGWDLLLVGWSASGVNAPALLNKVRSRLPHTPVIVLNVTRSRSQLGRALRLGARDWFEKGDLEGLRAAALREIHSASTAAEARRREQELVDRNRALLAETVEQARLFEALNRLARAASGELSTARLGELTVDFGRQLVGRVRGVLGLWDETHDRLRILDGKAARGEGGTVPCDGVAAIALRGGQPVIVNDYATWPGAIPAWLEIGVVSVIAVPVLVSGRAIGVLAFWAHEPREFTPKDAEVALMLAGQVAPAIDAARAHEALLESEQRYRTLFESAIEGAWYVDARGRTIYANRRMAEILRTDLATLMKRTLWDFTHPDDEPEQRKIYARRLNGWSGRADRRYIAADGTAVWGSVSTSPIRDQSGSVVGLVALVTDLSTQKAAEQALQESEEKSRFLAAMSHELRTPLNSILGFAQLLEDPRLGRLTARQRRYLDHIQSQGQHLLELINDVLDLSKVAAGRLEVKREEVNVAGVLAEVAARMQPLAATKGQELNLEATQKITVTADRLRLTQALLNLVSNAVKFTPEGGQVTISANRFGSQIAISVTDNGPGIAPEDQALAFDEFSKLSQGRRGEGTGLGLSLTRRLIEAMGGRITLKSQVGKGCMFTIAFPELGVLEEPAVAI